MFYELFSLFGLSLDHSESVKVWRNRQTKLSGAQIFKLLTLMRMTKDEKALVFFQRLIALKCLMCQKIQKISNPPLGTYLVDEPNFSIKN
jgi:hypothetical protein